jgi:ABC-type branched-subunit amino acid transport system substrate-binding protein
MTRPPLFASIVLILIVLVLPAPAYGPAEKEPIILGQSCALTGPSRYLGIELRSGLLAAFAEANQQGGVNGREIVLLTIDDGYEPYLAIANTRHLIEKTTFS